MHKGRRRMDASKSHSSSPPEPVIQGAVIPSTRFPPDVLDIVCMRTLAGDSLSLISKGDDMPSKVTLLKWLNQDPAFMERYTGCLRVHALGRASEMQDIADGKTVVSIEKVTVNSDGGETTTFLEVPEDVQRSALRVKTMQWTLTRLLPKVFGDKVQTDISVSGDLAELLRASSNSGHELPGEYTND